MERNIRIYAHAYSYNHFHFIRVDITYFVVWNCRLGPGYIVPFFLCCMQVIYILGRRVGSVVVRAPSRITSCGLV